MDSIETTLKTAVTSLIESGSPSAAIDAAVLLCHVLNKPRSYLLTWPDKTLAEQELQQFQSVLARRISGEPVAYITGEREFWSLPLKVSPATLIPRPDTERLVELALQKVQSASPSHILDLGTGTGAIALAIASECPQHQILGIDLQQQATELAGQNAQNLAINNVHFIQGSWFEPLKVAPLNKVEHQDKIEPQKKVERQKKQYQEIKFTLIVSNPPYIEKNDPHLVAGDVRFEPISALVAEEKGLADIRTIATEAVHFLEPAGWLMFEHGFEQGHAVRELLSDMGYINILTEQDYNGHDRVTYGQFFGTAI